MAEGHRHGPASGSACPAEDATSLGELDTAHAALPVPKRPCRLPLGAQFEGSSGSGSTSSPSELQTHSFGQSLNQSSEVPRPSARWPAHCSLTTPLPESRGRAPPPTHTRPLLSQLGTKPTGIVWDPLQQPLPASSLGPFKGLLLPAAFLLAAIWGCGDHREERAAGLFPCARTSSAVGQQFWLVKARSEFDLSHASLPSLPGMVPVSG